MRSLSALFILGCVAGSSFQPHGWTPSNEYRYTYSSQVLTGIPELNNQYSGVRLSTQVRIQPKQDSSYRVQLDQPRFVSYNDVLEWDHDMRPTSGQEQEIPSSIKTWLETPFTVFHKRGLVEKIQTEAAEPEFIVNIKKAFVSQVQYDFSKTQTSQDQNQVPRQGEGMRLPVFTSSESSVLGKCETEYTVTKLPAYLALEMEQSQQRQVSECQGKDYYEIIKTKNLDSCTEQPTAQYNYGVWPKSDGSGSSTSPSQSSVTRTIICGSLDNYVIRKSSTKNTILVSASGRYEVKEKLDISSFTTLELESIERVGQEISQPSSPKTYPSLVFEYPSGSPTSSKSLKKEVYQTQQGQQQQQKQQQITAPLPDLESAPTTFYPKASSHNELKQKFLDIFSEIIESSEKTVDSSKTKKDVAGMTVTAVRILSQLSLQEMKSLEESIQSQCGKDRYESLIQKVFFDLVSMTGTNPSIMVVKEKIMSGEVSRDSASWSWILSNSLRNVRTPTPQLLEKLVDLMKEESIQRSRPIRSAYVLGLTNLVYRACVNPVTVEYQFAYKAYGQMCNSEMPVIKENLIPYLTQQLYEYSSNDMNAAVTYINALGNLGIKESSEELLKVVEGKNIRHPHLRSLATYLLIRSTIYSPSLYRPVFLSIIENTAENPEVRMAAITALPYFSPSSADLQKLALRTWFEPSRQVSSYTYATLKSLAESSQSNIPVIESLRQKARMVLPMAKPSKEGIQFSRSFQQYQFINTLKSSVSHELQWQSSEESIIPKSIHARAELIGVNSNTEALETTFYIQGAQYVLDKLAEMYTDMKYPHDHQSVESNKQELSQLLSSIGIQIPEPKQSDKPELHFTLKFMGLQKIFTLDEEVVQNIVRKLSSEVAEFSEELERGFNKEYFKILDLSGSEQTMPTESGMPVYIQVRNPTVAYNKAEIKASKETGQPRFEMKMKGVTHYKRQVDAGVYSPISGKFHGAGVETSMRITIPVRVEGTVSRGQVHISLKQIEEPEYQVEHPMVEFDVLPFTASQSLSEFVPFSKSRDVKTIQSRNPELKNEMNIGKPFGLDLTIKATTEESGLDVYKLWDDLKINVPVFLTSLPNPVTSSRRTSIKIMHNPRSSEVKEIEFYFSSGWTTKKSHTDSPSIQFLTQNKNAEMKRICSTYSTDKQQCMQQLKQTLQSPKPQVVNQCQKLHASQQKQQLKQAQQQQQQSSKIQTLKEKYQPGQQLISKPSFLQSQSIQLKSQRSQYILQQCIDEQSLCEAQKQLCSISRNFCKKIIELCNQKVVVRQQLKQSIEKVGKGSAWSLSMGTVLRGNQESEVGRVETVLTLANRLESVGQEQGHAALRMTVQSPKQRQPFTVEASVDSKYNRPGHRWEVEDILKEDLTSNWQIEGEYGYEGEEKKAISSSIFALRSDKHESMTRQSEECQKCSQDQSEGKKLTWNCKQCRHMAASLDVVHAQVKLPEQITEHKLSKWTAEAIKAYFFPYMSQKQITSTQGQGNEYEVEARVPWMGDGLTVKVSGNGNEVEFGNIRLGHSFRKLLPFCTKYSLLTHVLQKLTSESSPSSCIIESGKVKTFDKMEYTYPMNDCEHVVFTESSTSPRVVVTTKKDHQKQTLKMIVDGQKYEVEIKRGTRYSRSEQAVIRVNGQIKEMRSVQQQQRSQLQSLQGQQQQSQSQQQLPPFEIYEKQEKLKEQLEQLIEQLQKSKPEGQAKQKVWMDQLIEVKEQLEIVKEQIKQHQQPQLKQQLNIVTEEQLKKIIEELYPFMHPMHQLQQNQPQVHQQLQQSLKQVQSLLQQQKHQFNVLRQNYYNDDDTYITSYEDGVYTIVSKVYGVEVIADSERLEVKSSHHLLRNKATGLCGDLNGEWKSDMKSAKGCIMSEPKLAAFSFMIENGQCRGIPEQHKRQVKRQEQRCVRPREEKTKVSQIIRWYMDSQDHPEQRHLVEEIDNKTCFSMQQVYVCPRSHPKEIRPHRIGFTCMSGPIAKIMTRNVMRGDQIEELEGRPTHYVKTIYEPRHC